MKKAIFLDRDGTINDNHGGYVNKPDDLMLYPFAAEAISRLNKAGFLVLVVTNQGGIARGYLTPQDVEAIHKKMIADLLVQGAHIDDIFFSPYYLKGHIKPFDIQHQDRKPDIGMFNTAREKYNFNIKGSYMIGDKYTDIEFGKKAGLKTILLLTGDGEEEFLQKRSGWASKPDYITPDLSSAVNLIFKLEQND